MTDTLVFYQDDANDFYAHVNPFTIYIINTHLDIHVANIVFGNEQIKEEFNNPYEAMQWASDKAKDLTGKLYHQLNQGYIYKVQS
ncbi:MAG: hypothetical protein ACYSR0_00515 [Planctomycetota bacterium]